MAARPRSILAAMGLALIVAACGGTSAGVRPSWLLSDHLGQPQGITAVGLPGEGARDAVLRSEPGRLEVVTWGSSGCPRLPLRLTASMTNALSVTMSNGAPPDGTACTADLAPTTSVIEIPSAIDLAQPVDVTVVDGVFGISLELAPPG